MTQQATVDRRVGWSKVADDLRRALRTLDELTGADGAEPMVVVDARSAVWRALVTVQEAERPPPAGAYPRSA